MKKILKIMSEFVLGGIFGIILGFVGLVIGALSFANYPIEFAHGGGYEVGGFLGALLGIAIGSFLGIWLFSRIKKQIVNLKASAFCAGAGVLLALILLKFMTDVLELDDWGFVVLALPFLCAVFGANKK